MQNSMILRHKIIKFIRDYLDNEAFLEIETPILFKATPEGARDFLVPSRIQPGKFYALPQSPQQLKQLLMVGGYERYFQIARCFRDEDLRGDRQPEFTQLDLEMSFVEREDVMQLNEALMQAILDELLPDHPTLGRPFPRLRGTSHGEVRLRPAGPALRPGRGGRDRDHQGSRWLPRQERQERPAREGTARRTHPAGRPMSKTAIRGFTKELEDLAKQAGGKGLGYVLLQEGDKPWGALAKFFSEDQIAQIAEKTGAQDGDLIFFISDKPKNIYPVVDVVRRELARQLDLVGENKDMFAFLWVVDFPLFEDYDEEEDRWLPSQHMFTMPMPEDVEMLDTDPGKVRGSQYDMVCNGLEIGGGSIRIHNREFQEKDLPAHWARHGKGLRGIRAHAGSLRVRRTAARRHGLGHRPAGDDSGAAPEHPRGDRLPEDANRLRRDGQSAVVPGAVSA